MKFKIPKFEWTISESETRTAEVGPYNLRVYRRVPVGSPYDSWGANLGTIAVKNGRTEGYEFCTVEDAITACVAELISEIQKSMEEIEPFLD